MKIVFIATKGIHKIGGIETYTAEVGARLVTAGHDVIVYTPKNTHCRERFTYNGIQIIPLNTIKHRKLEKLSLVILASFHQFLLRDVDIVHYHAIGPSLFSFIPRLVGRKTVIQSHGHEHHRSSWGLVAKLFFKISERLSFIFANDYTAVSKELTTFYKNKYKKDVTYIPNGINLIKNEEANEILNYDVKSDKYILFLGRISREKGIHYLIEAYQSFNIQGIKLVIVGAQREGDSYLEELQTLAGHNKNIIFAGEARGQLWREWYSNAGLFVLPSEIEGLPISLLEAMGFGNSCLVSDIPANVEALGKKGFVFENKNINSLREQLINAFTHTEKSMLFAEGAKKRAINTYTWDSVSDKLISFYLKVISETTITHNSYDSLKNT